jgi:hypothetical protein
MAPLGSLQAGWLAERFGVRLAVASGGLVCLAVAGGVAWGMWRVGAGERAGAAGEAGAEPVVEPVVEPLAGRSQGSLPESP